MLYRMKITEEFIGVVVANDGQGIISVDDFAQLNEKSVEGICWVLLRPEGIHVVCPILGLQCQKWLKGTYKE